MREIKFRYWIIGENKMSFSENLFMCDPEAGIIQYADQGYYVNNEGREPEFIIMQYTGLKDKNGKEIYEGDVVEGTPYITIGKKIKAVVIWNNVKAMYQVKEITNHECPDYEYLFEALREYHQTEVIGNIHETPELLKPQP